MRQGFIQPPCRGGVLPLKQTYSPWRRTIPPQGEYLFCSCWSSACQGHRLLLFFSFAFRVVRPSSGNIVIMWAKCRTEETNAIVQLINSDTGAATTGSECRCQTNLESEPTRSRDSSTSTVALATSWTESSIQTVRSDTLYTLPPASILSTGCAKKSNPLGKIRYLWNCSIFSPNLQHLQKRIQATYRANFIAIRGCIQKL